jgi:hypothetical protein
LTVERPRFAPDFRIAGAYPNTYPLRIRLPIRAAASARSFGLMDGKSRPPVRLLKSSNRRRAKAGSFEREASGLMPMQ